MEESFFGFKSNLSLNNLEDGKLEEQLLTDNVDEEEYDALNDETFGIGANDGDWEEDHDKFAGLLKEQSSVVSQSSSLFDVSGFDEDSQHEIVTQSISQLGLEDDLDDPAIMTIGRSRNIWPVSHINRSSPPPPAIIDPELCGSPKTHSIWSTNNTSTPAKESGIGSLFSSLSNSCSSYQHHISPVSPVPCNVFSSPLASKAWTVEELERDLTSTKATGVWSSTSSNHSEQNSSQTSKFSVLSDFQTSDTSFSNQLDKSVEQKTVPGIRTLDDVETDILLKHQTPTVEEIERSMKSKPVCRNSDLKRTYVTPPMGDGSFKPSLWPVNTVRSGFSGPIGPRGIRHNGPFAPFATPVITGEKPNNFTGAFQANYKPLPVYPQALNAMSAAAAFGKAHVPAKKQVFYPTSVLNPQNMKGLVFRPGPGRFVRYPILGTPVPEYTWQYAPPNRFNFSEGDARSMSLPDNYDEYAGLMTQREKEWLLRIQLMLVQTDNPYVEDFYYSTFITRKCVKEAMKNRTDKRDGPKLLLPERSKTETKAYVPAQFEGSLGKLQAVSVNFPRKVLDITVSRPLEDDEGHPITNQSVMKNRRLLLNIEKLYNFLLEVDDEEKRIFALPEKAHATHHEEIEVLTEKLFAGMGCETVTTSDTFQNIMMVRKGRNLGMRSFKIFSKEQKLIFLVALCRCFSHILRKDQNDMVLLKNYDSIMDHIKLLSLPELVSLGQSLENLPRTDTVIVPNPVREKSNFISAFKYKFGTTFVCCIMQQAEDIYAGYELIDSEDQAKWAKVVLHIVDIICTLPDSSIVPPIAPYVDLLAHFQRFPVDRDKFEVLKKKLKLFKSDSPAPDGSV